MGDNSPTSWQRVLRVIQLDSAILDEEVLQLLQSQLKNAFKYFQGGALKWQPELNFLMRFLLWRYTIYENSATIGQSLFNVQYGFQTNKGCKPITLKHKLIIGFVYVAKHWISERLDDFMIHIDPYSASQKIRKALRWLENFWQLASLINFMVFMQDGIYVSLFERSFGLRHIYCSKQMIRKGNYDYMNRELLWHGCAEFIFFLLPLVNIQKLKSFVKRITNRSQHDVMGKSDVLQIASNFCPICDKKPIHPQFVPCGHIYCYYCIKANCLADPSFKCTICDAAVDDQIVPLTGKLVT